MGRTFILRIALLAFSGELCYNRLKIRIQLKGAHMFPYKPIVSDLDGTLLNSKKDISERNPAALQKARKRCSYRVFDGAFGDDLNDLETRKV